MSYEMTAQERRELLLQDFMKEMVDIVARRLDEQSRSIEFVRAVADDLKDDIAILQKDVQDLKEKQTRLSRDILSALIR